MEFEQIVGPSSEEQSISKDETVVFEPIAGPSRNPQYTSVETDLSVIEENETENKEIKNNKKKEKVS